MTKNRRQKLEARRRKEAGAGSYTRALREASEGSVFVRKPISVPTGFSVLDEWTGGWMPGGLSVIGARSGDGKSAFAIHSALTALQAGKSVLFASLEMNEDEVRQRMIASKASVTISQVRLETNPYTHRLIGNARKVLGELSLTLDAAPRQTVEHIRERALELIATERGLDLVVVDYFELITPSLRESGATRQEQFAAVSRDLKLMAVELGVPVLVTVQVSRPIGEEYLPKLSEIREAGALVQDADQVVLLHRRSTEWTDEEILSLSLAKNRGGPAGQTGEIVVNFARLRFDELSIRGNPILQEYYRGLYAGEFTIPELLDSWTVDAEGATDAHRREAAAELRILEPFRSDFAASRQPLRLLDGRIDLWGLGLSNSPLRRSDGLTVWELGEDGGIWFVEGTLDKLEAIAAVRKWLEDTERGLSSEFSQAAGPFSASARSDFFWEGFFWNEEAPEPLEESELLARSRDQGRWNGETTLAGVLVQG